MSRGSLGKVSVAVTPVEPDATEAEVLAVAEGDPGLFEIRRTEVPPPVVDQACDWLGWIGCDPPIRGGVHMTLPGVGACTAGFTVRSRTDAKPYMLTAGHCNVTGGNWRSRFASGSEHIVGWFHNSEATSVNDSGIIVVNNPSGWSCCQPLITIDGNGSETAQEAYVIDDVHNPGFGDRMCRTGGRSSRTDCGTVIDLDDDGANTDDLFRVDGQCSIGGDSGGPYFSFHIAYGIHSAGPSCGGVALAQRALEAAARMNVYIVEA